MKKSIITMVTVAGVALAVASAQTAKADQIKPRESQQVVVTRAEWEAQHQAEQQAQQTAPKESQQVVVRAPEATGDTAYNRYGAQPQVSPKDEYNYTECPADTTPSAEPQDTQVQPGTVSEDVQQPQEQATPAKDDTTPKPSTTVEATKKTEVQTEVDKPSVKDEPKISVTVTDTPKEVISYWQGHYSNPYASESPSKRHTATFTVSEGNYTSKVQKAVEGKTDPNNGKLPHTGDTIDFIKGIGFTVLLFVVYLLGFVGGQKSK